MDDQLSELGAAAERTWRALLDYLTDPWVGYQLLVVVVLFVAARLIAKRVEPALERRARAIKGNPGLLRMVAALLRRSHWVAFVVLLGATVALVQALTWAGRTHLLSVVLWLAFAWLSVSVLSRIIRSRALAKLVAAAVWIYVATSILGITDDVAAVLDGLGFAIGEIRITALLVVKAVVLLTVTLWLATSVGNLLDNRIQRSDELTPSMRVLLGKLLKITLLVIGGVAAVSALGVDMTAFTVFSGAVGVGVGFGLQKVVSNFVSGVIILMDRSIKPGDTISLGETFGWIRGLRARFVSVVTRDGREFLIPNEDFITREVINWSFSNELVRLDVEFGVSYDSDPHEVSELAVQAAASVERVVSSREPVCWLTGFGDFSLDFVLRFWISDPQNGITNIRGKVLLALWDLFKEHGIAIPYPHREVIVKTPIRLEGGRP